MCEVQISIWENQNRIVKGCRICRFGLSFKASTNVSIPPLGTTTIFQKVGSAGPNSLQQRGYQMSLKILIFDDLYQCTEVRFASFLSSEFITAIVVNPPERNLAKRTSVQWPVFFILVPGMIQPSGSGSF